MWGPVDFRESDCGVLSQETVDAVSSIALSPVKMKKSECNTPDWGHKGVYRARLGHFSV